MNQEQHAHKSRLPKGAFKGRPIALRLTLEVRKTVPTESDTQYDAGTGEAALRLPVHATD